MDRRNPAAGEVIRIKSVKHDGSLHRAWNRSVILDNGDPLLLANRDVEVTEGDGSQWISKGLAICQFHREYWFNTIILFESEEFYRFYCNIASPYRWEKGTLVYTDYELDMVVDRHFRYQWLDRDEFEKNRRRMNYPAGVILQVERAVGELERRVKERIEPFTPEFVRAGYHRYLLFEKRIRGEERKNEHS